MKFVPAVRPQAQYWGGNCEAKWSELITEVISRGEANNEKEVCSGIARSRIRHFRPTRRLDLRGLRASPHLSSAPLRASRLYDCSLCWRARTGSGSRSDAAPSRWARRSRDRAPSACACPPASPLASRHLRARCRRTSCAGTPPTGSPAPAH